MPITNTGSGTASYPLIHPNRFDNYKDDWAREEESNSNKPPLSFSAIHQVKSIHVRRFRKGRDFQTKY